MAPRPTAQQLKVATDDLRAEAKIWERDSDALSIVASNVTDLKFNRLEAGLFQAFVSTHTDLVELVSQRCKEGSTAFENTGSTLTAVANTYDEEDRLYADRLKDLW